MGGAASVPPRTADQLADDVRKVGAAFSPVAEKIVENGFDEDFIRTVDDAEAKEFLEENGVKGLTQKRLLKEFAAVKQGPQAPIAAAAVPAADEDGAGAKLAARRRFLNAASDPFRLEGAAFQSWFETNVIPKFKADLQEGTRTIGAALVDGPTILEACCEDTPDPPGVKITKGADGAKLPGPYGRVYKVVSALQHLHSQEMLRQKLALSQREMRAHKLLFDRAVRKRVAAVYALARDVMQGWCAPSPAACPRCCRRRRPHAGVAFALLASAVLAQLRWC